MLQPRHGLGDGCACLGPGVGSAAPEIVGMTTCIGDDGGTGWPKRGPARAWRARMCLCAGVRIAWPVRLDYVLWWYN